MRVDDVRPWVVVFEVHGVPYAVVVEGAHIVRVFDAFVIPAYTIIAHKGIFHIPDKAFVRVHAVNGDLLYKSYFFVLIANSYGDLDEFFLYRGKIGIEP